MGTWGYAAWDNDQAADWFGVMFEKTQLAQYVEQTLQGDAREMPDKIRAVACVRVSLGKAYIWPEPLQAHLRLAIDKLQQIKTLFAEDGQDPERLFEAAIDAEIAALRANMPLTS